MSTEYSQNLYELSYGDGIEHYWWHLARNRIILDELKRFGAATPSILDVGCGRGITVKYLREQGFACDGVELGTTRPLDQVLGHVRYGLDAVELPENDRVSYDTILLLDVIEHLPDPVAFIRTLIGAFPSLTQLVVTVPACPELWSNYDEVFGHYRRYTAAAIEDLANALNVDIQHQSYFFHLLYVPARFLAALKMQRSTHVRPPPSGWVRLLHGLMGMAMVFDYKICPARVPGMSAIASFRVR